MNANEEKIIMATFACIERYGIKHTTIRRIGMTAGVNSAAISYYFRSKDALMARVMDVAIGNAFDMENFRDSEGLPAAERLTAVLEGMLAGAFRYPNLTRAFFTELISKNDYDVPVVAACNAFLDTLCTELAEMLTGRTAGELKMLLMQAACATFLFPGIFPGFFTGCPEINLTDDAVRHKYIKSLVDHLLI